MDIVACEHFESAKKHPGIAAFLEDNKPGVSNIVVRLGGLPAHALKGAYADTLP